MAGHETELEMVRRHIREGEAHVTRQREIVAVLLDGSNLRQLAEALLLGLEESLWLHHVHLARLEATGGNQHLCFRVGSGSYQRLISASNSENRQPLVDARAMNLH